MIYQLKDMKKALNNIFDMLINYIFNDSLEYKLNYFIF